MVSSVGLGSYNPSSGDGSPELDGPRMISSWSITVQSLLAYVYAKRREMSRARDSYGYSYYGPKTSILQVSRHPLVPFNLGRERDDVKYIACKGLYKASHRAHRQKRQRIPFPVIPVLPFKFFSGECDGVRRYSLGDRWKTLLGVLGDPSPFWRWDTNAHETRRHGACLEACPARESVPSLRTGA